MKVVVTGIGIESCLGSDIDSFWNNIVNGVSGMKPWMPKSSVIKTRQVGTIDNFRLNSRFDSRWRNKTDRHVQMALNATKQAIDSSGIYVSQLDPARVHTVVGACAGSYESIITGQKDLDQGQTVLPNFIPGHLLNMTSAFINMHYGIQGSGLAVAGACAAGNQALAVASMLIETGQADVVVTGASDSWISDVVIGGLESLGAISHDDILPRPFDSNRSGFAISEGAGILILESEQHAVKRGANILAHLSGYAFSSDAYHPTSPAENGVAAKRAINQSLAKAKLNANDINYVNAHATATKVGDIVECMVLDQSKLHCFLSSTKSMTGHSTGAASAIEAIISVLAIKNKSIPGTINLENIDPQCVGNHVRETIDYDVKHVLSNSFGFGGTNGTVIFSEY